jgi:hypothetical protein
MIGPLSCQCGRLTGSETGVCDRCRRLADAEPTPAEPVVVEGEEVTSPAPDALRARAAGIRVKNRPE